MLLVTVGLIGVFRIKQYIELEGAAIDEGAQLDDIQLVTSRDGFRFTRVAGRAPFIPKSEPPKWGTGGQRLASHMLVHDDKVLIYYGSRAKHQGGGLEIGLATTARDRFASVVCIGVAVMFFWHVLINIGMVSGLLPIVGVTLPLVSYGGSSVLTFMIGAGLLMNVSIRRYSY